MKKDKEINGLAKDSNQPSHTRDYFPFYYSFKDAIQELNDADKLAIYEAITDFSFFHQEPTLTTPFSKLCWKLIQPILNKSWERSKAGAKHRGNQYTNKRDNETKLEQTRNKMEQNGTNLGQTWNYNDNDNNNDKDNDNNNDNIKENISKRKVVTFHAPVLDDVVAYCIEKHYNIDVEQFMDYYTANGWMVGKNKMKDWRAAVRNWVRRSKEISNSNNNQHGTEREQYTNQLEQSIYNDIKSIE